MVITQALKAHALAKGWIAAGATDDQIRAALGERIIKGELTPSDLAKLSTGVVPTGREAFESMVSTQVKAATNPLMELIATQGKLLQALADKASVPLPPPPAPVPPTTPADPIDAAVEKRLTAMGLTREAVQNGNGMFGLLARSADVLERPEPRVISAIEKYSTVKTAAIYPTMCGMKGNGSKHPLAGKQATAEGRVLDLPSDRDKAVSAVWFKWALTKAHAAHEIPRKFQLTPHDKDILNWAMKNAKWTGFIGSNAANEYDSWAPGEVPVNRRNLTDMEQKALLDDTVSGGIEIAPIQFDDALVTVPVLFGEIWPLVDVIPVTRGRRMKGGVVTNPTFTWGTAEGTAIQPFNTSAFVTAFDTTIFPVVGVMEVGLDFEEDSPTNVGSIIIQKYGEKFQEQLDLVVAIGDGVTQPQGVFNAASIVVVPSDFNIAGPATLGDYETLLFAVAKQYRNTKGSRNVFLGTETTYRRARAIPVGAANEIRLMGTDYSSYEMIGHPFKLTPFATNNQLAFVNLGYYRAYRRLGYTVRMESSGQYLSIKNTRLILVRARLGGRLELPGAASLILDAQN